LLAVYGTDSVLTIIHRLRLRQNIFKAHKLHLYQVIISVKKVPHLIMTVVYMIIQVTINGVVIYYLNVSQQLEYVIGVIILAVLVIAYLVIKRKMFKALSNVQ
jgi:hypothetical protein